MYLPYVQLWLTAATIQATEARIGYRLPAAWIALLRIQNGSYIGQALPKVTSHHL